MVRSSKAVARSLALLPPMSLRLVKMSRWSQVFVP